MSNLLRFISLCLLVCFPLKGIPQTDSLLQLLSTLPNDTTKAIVLEKIAYSFLYSDRDKSQLYVDSLIHFSQKIDYGLGVRGGQYLAATIQHFNGNQSMALRLVKEAIAETRRTNDKANLARNLNILCFIHQSQNNLEAALEAIQESLALCIETKRKDREAVAYCTIASVYQYLKENKTAKSYLEKAIPIFTDLNDQYRLGVVYQSLATVSYKQEAYEYAQKGLAMLLSTDDIQGQGMCYWSMGAAQYEMNNKRKALEHYQSANDIFIKVNYPEGIANMNASMGLIYTELGEVDIAYPLLTTARNLVNEGNFEDALQNVFTGLTKYHVEKNNPNLAFNYMDSLKALKDSLFNKEKADILIESETKLKTREKEAQLAQKDLELERQSNLRNAIILSSLLVISTLLFLFFFIRNRQKTKQQQAELALQLERTKARQLRALDEIKSNFFANISHEFRTPLTLILGPLEQMRKGLFKGDKQAYFEIMHRNGKRLQDLINQLLDLSKLENSKMLVNNVPEDIHQFIRQIVSSLESWAIRKKIHYKVTIPKTANWVYFDKDKIQKILVNLLSNALKYTASGGEVHLSIYSKKEENQEMINLTVTDTGTGIPFDEVGNIFERFYQSSQPSDGMASSGIGLALTKELVVFLGGIITVKSEVGEGTTFQVKIPFEKASPIYNTVEKEVGKMETSTLVDKNRMESPLVTNKNNPIILIVEDNEDVRRYIADQLTEKYQIVVAENGKIGVEKAIKIIPDLVITDVMMPEMNGTDLSKKLKNDEKTSHIPIIILTAKAEQSQKLVGLKVGADDYLIKPFDAKELQVRVNNLIEQRRKLRERFTKESIISVKDLAVTSVDDRFLHRLMEVIETNMDNEKFSIEDFGKQVAMSRSQLHRKIKALTDKSPSVFLRSIRLNRAKKLLTAKAGNATEVAFMVGFSNAAYFSKCFKDEFELTPTEVLNLKNS